MPALGAHANIEPASSQSEEVVVVVFGTAFCFPNDLIMIYEVTNDRG